MVMMIFLQLQSKASLYLNLFRHASTFNPNGSSSSTEDKNDKTKQRKLQKVRVKNNKLKFQNFEFRPATKLFIMNVETYKLENKKNEADYEVRKIEKLIAEKESKMMQLKSDLEIMEKTKAKAKFISLAMVLFFIVMKCLMI